ncbi:MAG: phosphatase PAP2 family protein [Candidatus Latescibacterota bacterium]|nr:MAG: phosphatase PAP2 family protein [Candidatus Latescibacterota bacterium]
MRRETHPSAVLPLALVAGLTILFRIFDWDLAVQRLFWSAESGWPWVEPEPWRSLYGYGPLPAIAIGVGALAVFLAGLRSARLARRRAAALYFVLLLIVGPGILVNVLCKDHWGRPRPRDLAEFGGQEPFWEVLEWRPGGEGHSFPSGHASSGFYLLAPFFPLRRTRPRRALFFLALGLAYGVLMGMARIGQGAHFASDVLWAFALVYFPALGLARLLGLDRPPAS